jgi:hypothetical protein
VGDVGKAAQPLPALPTAGRVRALRDALQDTIQVDDFEALMDITDTKNVRRLAAVLLPLASTVLHADAHATPRVIWVDWRPY